MHGTPGEEDEDSSEKTQLSLCSPCSPLAKSWALPRPALGHKYHVLVHTQRSLHPTVGHVKALVQ